MTCIALWFFLNLVAFVLMLGAEYRGLRVWMGLFKASASACFIGAAIAMGAAHTPYGKALLVALALSWWGDVFLLSPSARWFQAGLVSFLLAHFAFGAAFLFLGADVVRALITFGILVAVVLALMRWWLFPHVPKGMMIPVIAYIVVITVMLGLAVNVPAERGRTVIAAGAILFYVSDLTVARNRFVRPGFVNSLAGIPMYYWAQLLFAYSASLV